MSCYLKVAVATSTCKIKRTECTVFLKVNVLIFKVTHISPVPYKYDCIGLLENSIGPNFNVKCDAWAEMNEWTVATMFETGGYCLNKYIAIHSG